MTGLGLARAAALSASLGSPAHSDEPANKQVVIDFYAALEADADGNTKEVFPAGGAPPGGSTGRVSPVDRA